jgi:4,5-DOPA dioxygenase extradiol
MSPSESRRTFLRAMAAGAVTTMLPLGCARSGSGEHDDPEENVTASSKRMPVLFVGHGSPMNVIEDNAWSRGFAELRGLVPEPKVILAVSAHWFVPATLLTADERPRTIHDFSGFPRALYEIEYPAGGSVDLAREVRGLLGEEHAALSSDWGLDHGTWSVLRGMFPSASVPVVQLSIDRRLDVRRHFELARSLAALRDEGVLILGSGNVVHNLKDAFARMRSARAETPDWASRFDRAVADAVAGRDTERLLELASTEDGSIAHPTLDHFLPLIYAYAATDAADRASFPIEGFDLGSISMRSVRLG